MNIREEIMAPFFHKSHLEGVPFQAVIHRFTASDGHGSPHDHPWGFQSTILHGGYREEVFSLVDGSSWFVDHRPGDSFHNPADHIHRIVELFADEVWAIIQPQAWERKSGFYQFRDGIAFHRFWDEREFVPLVDKGLDWAAQASRGEAA